MGHTNKMKPGLRGRFIFKRHCNTCSHVKGAIFCGTIEIHNQTLRVQSGGVGSNVRSPVIASAKYNLTGRTGVFNGLQLQGHLSWKAKTRRVGTRALVSRLLSSDIKCVEYPPLLALDSTASAEPPPSPTSIKY